MTLSTNEADKLEELLTDQFSSDTFDHLEELFLDACEKGDLDWIKENIAKIDLNRKHKCIGTKKCSVGYWGVYSAHEHYDVCKFIAECCPNDPRIHSVLFAMACIIGDLEWVRKHFNDVDLNESGALFLSNAQKNKHHDITKFLQNVDEGQCER